MQQLQMLCFLPIERSDCSRPCAVAIVLQSQLSRPSVLQCSYCFCCPSEHVCHILWPSCASLCFSLKEGEDQKEIKIEPADAVEEVEPLPEDYYTRPINLTEGNTLIFCHFLPLHFVTWAVPGNLSVGFLMAWDFSDFYAGIEMVGNLWLFKW